MLSKEFLIKEAPVLKTSDKGSTAILLMDEYKLRHLPLLEEDKYLCLLSERDILSMDNIEENLSKTHCYFAPYVGENTYILEVLRIISNDQLTLLPVVLPDGTFAGAITLPVVIEKVSEICNADSNGALITLEMNEQDYDLSNIARLIESNNARILSVFTYILRDTCKLLLMIKIDLEDASCVMRSFERFNYNVLYYFQKQGLTDDTQQRRLDELMYYLEM